MIGHIVVTGGLAVALAWPWSGDRERVEGVRVGEVRAASATIPLLPDIGPPTVPDGYEGHLHQYWEYLNCQALIARAERMRTLNMSARDKLRDIEAGVVAGIQLSEEQRRQRVFELNALYYEMVMISFETINDIAHADAYYLADLDPPFRCPPESGAYLGGE